MEQVGITLAPRTEDMVRAVETMFEGKLRSAQARYGDSSTPGALTSSTRTKTCCRLW